MPFNIANLDFGVKSDKRKKKRKLEDMLKDVRKKKRQRYLKELKHSKNKEKTFQKIANETMVMHSERKMLLKGGDKNRFSRGPYNSMNDIYKDEKLVFNRVSSSNLRRILTNFLDFEDDVHSDHVTIPLRPDIHFRVFTEYNLLRCCKTLFLCFLTIYSG